MSTITSSLRKTLLGGATSRLLLRPTHAAASLRPFSISRPTLNSASPSPTATATATAQESFHTTPSTLDVSSSVLGEPTARTLTAWQAGLWERLESEMQTNPKLSDYITRQRTLHPQGTLSMTDLLSFLSRDPTLSLAFNYASLLLNTSFFLEGLVKDSDLRQAVPAGYAGLEEQLVAQARGMVGSGWLWIVSCDRKITTIPTYGSGTVLVRNRMQQGRDATTPIFYPSTSSSSSSATSSTASSSSTNPTQQQQQPRENEDTADHPFIGTGTDYKPIKPLAVINLFEHAYLARAAAGRQGANAEGGGLDVWGKEQWVRDWLRMVDWAQVKSRAN